MDIVPLFCDIDDFCQEFEPWMEAQMLTVRQRQRKSKMCLSEVMTILVLFHLLGYRNFKQFYREYVCDHLDWAFPQVVSYNRFVELQRDALLPLCAYLKTRMGQCTGISFLDSTSLAVCHNRRIYSHRLFAEWAMRGKTSVDWFYGFKLHLVVNDEGELLGCCLTPGNVDDRVPVPELVEELWGKIFADRGYISRLLFETLFDQNIELFTKLKRNMKNKLMNLLDKILSRKRAIVETIIDQLKNISQIEHSRHRSPWNFLGNIVTGLIAYTWHPTKPSLGIRKDDNLLPALVF
jgi:hypothetical protein